MKGIKIMRKITALFLSILLVGASFALMISAAPDVATVGKVEATYTPAGTAVSTPEQFAAMEADKQYYLSADITVAASYATSFGGTFDGNGHTVTLTAAPLFVNLNGATVKNLTVNGTVTTSIIAKDYGYNSNASGAVAATANGNTTFENILNNADVTPAVPGNNGGSFYGGIVGEVLGATTFTFVNCVNTGDVKANNPAGNLAAGGILGLAYNKPAKVTLTGCVNTGEIYAKSAGATGVAAGLTAWIHTDTALTEYKDCVNEGKVSGYSKSGTTRVGGYLGYCAAIKVTFSDCVNSGAITADTDTLVNVTGGGFVGYNNTTSVTTDVVMEFTNCQNTADITYIGAAPAAYMAGLVAYTRRACTFTDCVNTGDIKSHYTGEGNKDYDAGGISDVLGASGVSCASTFKNCVNLGNLVADYRAGGMSAYVFGDYANSYPVFDGCVVICEKITGRYAGGLSAYFNAAGVVAKNNYIAVPTIESKENPYQANALFWDNKCTPKEGNVAGNIIVSNTKYLMAAGLNGETVAWAEEKTAGVEVANPSTLATVPSAEDLKSGKVAYEFNTAVGKTMLYQKLGTDGEAAPTAVPTEGNEIVFEDNMYFNPGNKPTVPETPSTGDYMPLIVIVAIAAMFGSAVVLSRKSYN